MSDIQLPPIHSPRPSRPSSSLARTDDSAAATRSAAAAAVFQQLHNSDITQQDHTTVHPAKNVTSKPLLQTKHSVKLPQLTSQQQHLIYQALPSLRGTDGSAAVLDAVIPPQSQHVSDKSLSVVTHWLHTRLHSSQWYQTIQSIKQLVEGSGGVTNTTALNSGLTQNATSDHSYTINTHTRTESSTADPLSDLHLSRTYLQARGVPRHSVDRLYRALWIYSAGMHECIQELTTHFQPTDVSVDEVVRNIWQAYAVLLEDYQWKKRDTEDEAYTFALLQIAETCQQQLTSLYNQCEERVRDSLQREQRLEQRNRSTQLLVTQREQELNSHIEQQQQVQQQLHDISKQNAELAQTISDRAAEHATLNTVTATLRSDLEQLQHAKEQQQRMFETRISALTEVNGELEQMHNSALQKIAKVSSENEQLQLRSQTLQQQWKQRDEEYIELSESKQRLEAEHERAVQHHKSQQSELQHLDRKCHTLQQQMEISESSRQTLLQQLKKRNDELMNTPAPSTPLHPSDAYQHHESQQKLQSLEQEKASLLQVVSEMTQVMGLMKEQTHERINGLEAEKQKLQQEVQQHLDLRARSQLAPKPVTPSASASAESSNTSYQATLTPYGSATDDSLSGSGPTPSTTSAAPATSSETKQQTVVDDTQQFANQSIAHSLQQYTAASTDSLAPGADLSLGIHLTPPAPQRDLMSPPAINMPSSDGHVQYEQIRQLQAEVERRAVVEQILRQQLEHFHSSLSPSAGSSHRPSISGSPRPPPAGAMLMHRASVNQPDRSNATTASSDSRLHHRDSTFSHRSSVTGHSSELSTDEAGRQVTAQSQARYLRQALKEQELNYQQTIAALRESAVRANKELRELQSQYGILPRTSSASSATAELRDRHEESKEKENNQPQTPNRSLRRAGSELDSLLTRLPSPSSKATRPSVNVSAAAGRPGSGGGQVTTPVAIRFGEKAVNANMPAFLKRSLQELADRAPSAPHAT